MDTATEYRHYADDCVAWAKTAITEEERDVFLKMAQDWLRAAAIMETSSSEAASPGVAPKTGRAIEPGVSRK
jgi:hypothetical protein